MADGIRVLVWGGGGHGKVVADLVRALHGVVLGYVDCDPGKLGQVVEEGGARVLVTEERFVAAAGAGRLPEGADAVALAIGDNAARLRAMGQLADAFLPALVHPSALVSQTARVGAGTAILPRAVVNASARIGSGVIVNTSAVVEHDCVVADGVHLSPAATLCGGVHVGRGSWIAAGSVVIPGIKIGSGAIVGAGAVVVRDVPDGAAVVGNPARLLRSTL